MNATPPPGLPADADLSTDVALQHAIAHHQAKRLEQAEQGYLEILRGRPFHPLANHNLGLLAGQRGQPAAGLPYLRAALSANPDEGQFWLSYAAALLQAQQAQEALEIMQGAVARGLDNAAALALLEQAEQAVAALRNAPSEQEIQHVVQLFHAGRYADLERATRALLQRYPDSAFAWSVLGTALQVQGKDALAALQTTVALAPADAEAHGNLGNALQAAGRYAEAVTSYQRALQLAPDFAAAHSNLGGAQQALGDSAAAVASYQRALQLAPDHAIAHFNLGNLMKAGGQFEAALESYSAAARLMPGDAEVLANLADMQRALGRYADAAASYRRQLAVAPDDAQAHGMLGVCLQNLNQREAALASHLRALTLDPARAETRANVGLIQQQLGLMAEAAASYRLVLAMEPESALIHTNLGTSLHAVRQFADAVACHRRAVEIDPDFAMAHCNLGAAHQALGQLTEAVASYRRAIALAPEVTLPHKNLTSALQNLRLHGEALEAALATAALAPDDAVVHFNLANSQRACGKSGAAIASFHRAIALDPAYSEAHSNLGALLQDQGRIEEALASCRDALALNPTLQFARSNLLFSMLHSNEVTPEQVYDEHRRFGAQVEDDLKAHWPAHGNDRDPLRRLRVGFVSGDFNGHAVANFMTPVLAHLAETPELELHAYYTNTLDDVVTARIRGYMAHWCDAAHLSDEALARRIQDDGIDLLVDLSGHTAKNRLRTFAHKPAPVQLSWIGYPGSTGLTAMDYYLSDRYFSPPGLLDDQFTEKLVCLPANVPFLPAQEAPPVRPAPALCNGYLTFGSFNRPSKLSRAVVVRWARLLRAVPDARMLLGAMPADDFQGTLAGWFAEEGIAAERLMFLPRTGLREYFAMHHLVDVCLDTFPYTGGTTTFNALWMGVPTLTMAGATLPSRSGACIMQQVGLEAFVARDDDDFVEKGRFIAGNHLLAATLRLGMRRRLEQSPMGQPQLIAAALTLALRTMWQRWCAGLPPAAFEILGEADAPSAAANLEPAP